MSRSLVYSLLLLALSITTVSACASDRGAETGNVQPTDNEPTRNNDAVHKDAAMTTNGKTTGADVKDACAVARAAIEKRDFLGWKGLPPCSGDALFDGFPANVDDRPKRSLGKTNRSVSFVLLELAGYYRPMANVADGKLVLVDGMNPEIGERLTPLLTELGKPDATLDWDYGTLPLPQREHVHATRGITLFLNTDRDRALHVALYAATDLDTYLESLRPRLAKKRLPAKK